MSYNSIGTFSSHNNKMEVELSSSKPTGCMCNLQLKKKKKNHDGVAFFNLYMHDPLL